VSCSSQWCQSGVHRSSSRREPLHGTPTSHLRPCCHCSGLWRPSCLTSVLSSLPSHTPRLPSRQVHLPLHDRPTEVESPPSTASSSHGCCQCHAGALREQRHCVICEDGVPAANPSWIERVLVRVRCVVLRLGQRSSSSHCTARRSGPAHLLHMPLLHV
jgi:hypothetical protein